MHEAVHIRSQCSGIDSGDTQGHVFSPGAVFLYVRHCSVIVCRDWTFLALTSRANAHLFRQKPIALSVHFLEPMLLCN